MKHSIRSHIVLLFTAAFGLMVFCACFWSYYNAYRSASQRGEYCARNSAKLVQSIVDKEKFEALFASDQTEVYQDTQVLLRQICVAFSLRYLYVYTVDPKASTKTYYMIAASDPEEDAAVRAQRGLGTVIPVSRIRPQELSALAGVEDAPKTLYDNAYGKVIGWVTPCWDYSGEHVLALISAEYNVVVEREHIWRNLLYSILPITLFLALTFLLLLRGLEGSVVQPIRAISRRMNAFHPDRTTQPVPLEITGSDEIREIAAAFNTMSGEIAKYLGDIETLTEERLQNQVQMEVARRIQCGMVPETARLSGESYALSAFALPARAVGGDFYDCFVRFDGRVCLVIGDISGKGITAALFMAMAKTMLREKLQTGLGPGEVLNSANSALFAMNPENLFTTVFAAVFDPGSGALTYANAGHNPPVLLRDRPEFLSVDPGIALGLFEDGDITECALTLGEGEGILLYTDGATEAVGAGRTFFGTARLLDAAAGKRTAEEVTQAVKDAVLSFSQGEERSDDLTVLTLVREPPWTALPMDPSAFSTVRERIESAAGSTPPVRRLLLICDEIIANIVSYSGAKELRFRVEDSGVWVAFSDDGVPFDPLQADRAEKDFEDLDSGGMGLSLLRQYPGEKHYERRDGKNILTLRLFQP